VTTYLKLEYVVHLIEFLLVSVAHAPKSATKLLVSLTELNGCPLSPSISFPCPCAEPLRGCVIPGGKLLKCLLSMLVVLPGRRLRESALGSPGNRRGSGRRDPRAHSADLRRRAHKGHGASMSWREASGEFIEAGGVGSLAVLLWMVVWVVRVGEVVKTKARVIRDAPNLAKRGIVGRPVLKLTTPLPLQPLFSLRGTYTYLQPQAPSSWG
jgi:hypothetical protein